MVQRLVVGGGGWADGGLLVICITSDVCCLDTGVDSMVIRPTVKHAFKVADTNNVSVTGQFVTITDG